MGRFLKYLSPRKIPTPEVLRVTSHDILNVLKSCSSKGAWTSGERTDEQRIENFEIKPDEYRNLVHAKGIVSK